MCYAAGVSAGLQIVSRSEARAASLKRYFTGRPCPSGHVSERQTSNGTCLECHRLRFAKRYSSDPAGRRAYLNEWREKNPERLRKYYRENVDYERQRRLKRHYDNPEEARRYARERRARYPEIAALDGKQRREVMIQRCVAWGNRVAIRSFYREARRLSVETGIAHQVDHIIPLRGKNVSGLHVETNLRVIPARLNQSKGNSFCPEMLAA